MLHYDIIVTLVYVHSTHTKLWQRMLTLYTSFHVLSLSLYEMYMYMKCICISLSGIY